MNISQYRKYDIANGPGIRSTIFVSGCRHNCKGCFNKEYMDFKNGEPYTQEFKEMVIGNIEKNPLICGVTILGGEPLQQIEDDNLIDLLKSIKERTNVNIWIFSGYRFEEIILNEDRLKILELCDVLVDGRFIEHKKDLKLKFRGSSNQRIIDIKKSLETNSIVLNEYN